MLINPPISTLTGAASGDLTGSFPGPTINPNATPQVNRFGIGQAAPVSDPLAVSSASVQRMLVTAAGQAQFPAQGSSGGVLIGTDTQLWRQQAGGLRLTGSSTLGLLQVTAGSTGGNAYINLLDGDGVDRWRLWKTTSNTFLVYDANVSRTYSTYNSGVNTMTFAGDAATVVGIGGSSAIGKSSVTNATLSRVGHYVSHSQSAAGAAIAYTPATLSSANFDNVTQASDFDVMGHGVAAYVNAGQTTGNKGSANALGGFVNLYAITTGASSSEFAYLHGYVNDQTTDTTTHGRLWGIDGAVSGTPSGDIQAGVVHASFHTNTHYDSGAGIGGSVVESGNYISTAYRQGPVDGSNATQLNGAIDAVVTTLTIDGTTGYPAAATVLIDTEQISYTGKTATTLTGCTRGANGTTAATHADNALVGFPTYPLDLGLGIGGKATNGLATASKQYGHKVGLRVGGNAGYYVNSDGGTSKIGEGIQVMDWGQCGIRIKSRYSGAAEASPVNLALEFDTAPTANATAMTIANGQTITVAGGTQIRGPFFAGTYNITAAPSSTNFLVNRFSPVINVQTGAGVNALQSPVINQVGPTVTLPASAGALGTVGTTWTAFQSTGTFQAATGGTTGTITNLNHFQATVVLDTGWTVTNYRGLLVSAPSGAGAITTFVGIDMPAVTTTTTTKYAIRAQDTAAITRLAGRMSVGANADPNTVSGIDCIGDFSTRSVAVTLANGVNDDIAIGNTSFVRITGPTGAFSISSIGTPYGGKRLTIYNTTAQAMTITHEAGTGTAANRIHTTDAANVVSVGEGTVNLIYEDILARWLVIGSTL